MLSKKKIHALTPTELLCLQKHVKLGKEHLSKILTKEEYHQLFFIVQLTSDTIKKLDADLSELTGKATIVINTIMTATLGAWMGLSTFLNFSLNSLFMFWSILFFSITLGVLIGLLSAWLAKKESLKILEKRRLLEIETKLLEEIIDQRQTEIDHKNSELIKLLKGLGIEVDIKKIKETVNLSEMILTWLSQVQDKKLSSHDKINLENLKKELKSKKQIIDKKDKDILETILKKLSHMAIQPQPNLRFWIRENIGSLFVKLIPTIFGVFSSCFVYLGGTPTIARIMGKEHFLHFIQKPEVKMLQLFGAILITLYFAWNYLHVNKKDYKRSHELQQIETYLIREENILDMLNDQLLKLKEAFFIISSIFQ